MGGLPPIFLSTVASGCSKSLHSLYPLRKISGTAYRPCNRRSIEVIIDKSSSNLQQRKPKCSKLD